MTIFCQINGEAASIAAADARTALLYVLRNDLGLVGARFGCGTGDCGACMVLIDGRPTNACSVAVEHVEGKALTTVEGLGDTPQGRALVNAFTDRDALQCGYCMSGILVSALSLLRANPDPSDADIRAALDGHLCRCGAHQRIVTAVAAAAASLQNG